ncbi:MAG: hypothetical protein PHV07_02865 [Oscillospiraceae bacterium]|nr:hypothetical protein [Oscillospiraceae bacterium]
MTILEKLRSEISGKLVDPLQDDLAETDWGEIDTIIKVEPQSVALISIAVVVVALIIIYAKKSI